jgi:hypothetical protein
LANGAALAITYGWDDDGKCQTNEPTPCDGGIIKYDGVGALVDGSGAYCSGTLVDSITSAKNPTGAPVFVTAAHCDYPGKVYVTFDRTFDITKPESQAIRASKGDRNGFTESTIETDYEATLADDGQWYVRGHDIAVVVFKAPDTDGEKVEFADLLRRPTAQLPEVDALETPINHLEKGQLFTAVGYGVDETLTHEGVRRYSESSFTSENSYYLSLSQQQRKTYGGTCYGDSGGAELLWGLEGDRPHCGAHEHRRCAVQDQEHRAAVGHPGGVRLPQPIRRARGLRYGTVKPS